MELKQLKTFVLIPTLQYLGLDSIAAQKLLLSTIAHESRGIHLDQRLSADDVTLGPAIGLYQIERPTLDLVNKWLQKRPALQNMIDNTKASYPDQYTQLATNLTYATCIARVLYYSIPSPLPDPNDEEGLWWYYKKHWNSMLGKATQLAWTEAYRSMVVPLYK